MLLVCLIVISTVLHILGFAWKSFQLFSSSLTILYSVISQASSHNSSEEKNRRNSSEERGKQSAGEEKRKASLSEGKLKKGTGEGKKRVSSVSSERGSKSPLKRAQDQSPRKRGRPPKDEKVCVVHVRQCPVDFADGLQGWLALWLAAKQEESIQCQVFLSCS